MALPKNTEPLEIVLTDDPALAADMDKPAYRRTRDPALIKLTNEAVKPHYFTLHPLSRTHARAIKAQFSSESQRCYFAALASLRRVVYPDGTKREPTDLQTLANTPKGEVWQTGGEEWEKYVLSILNDDQIELLGSIALDRACVPQGGGILPLR